MAGRTRSDLSRRAVLAGLSALPAFGARAGRGLVVLAAASLKPALDEIAAGWQAPVAVSYGGSGAMARQVAAGVPADLVILAAVDWMDWLRAQGALAGDPIAVAGNQLVLAGPPGEAPLALAAEAIAGRLGPNGRFAMGDPLSVPAGRYGQEALTSLGLWDGLRGRAILAENVRAALAYVVRGDVALGLVYASDTVGTGVARVAEIPASAHQPILYPGAVLPGADLGAAAFLAHVAASGAVFARHGFAPAPPA
jgi:molybdate transport system substrate-binding protein